MAVGASPDPGVEGVRAGEAGVSGSSVARSESGRCNCSELRGPLGISVQRERSFIARLPIPTLGTPLRSHEV